MLAQVRLKFAIVTAGVFEMTAGVIALYIAMHDIIKESNGPEDSEVMEVNEAQTLLFESTGRFNAESVLDVESTGKIGRDENASSSTMSDTAVDTKRFGGK